MIIPRELSVETVKAAAALQRTLHRALEVDEVTATDEELSMIASDLAASSEVLNEALDAIEQHIEEGL